MIADFFNLINSNSIYLFAAILIIGMVFTKIVAKVLHLALIKVASFTKTTRDDEIVSKMENPLVYLMALSIIYFGSLKANFISSVETIVLNLTMTLIVLISTYFLVLVADFILEVWIGDIISRTKSKMDDQLLNLFRKTISIVFSILGFIYVLYIWDVEILPLIGSLGIAGLAIAFALQETLKNLFGGISLILDKNITTGDIVVLSSGESGVIKDMSLRSTRIKTFDNKLVIVPNSVLANDIITNVSKPDRSRRVEVGFGVEYGTDPDYVKKTILKIVKGIENVTEDPEPTVYFKEMGDSALIFEARYWVKDLSHFLQAKEDGTIRIYDELNKKGISIPFPQMNVYVNDAGKFKSKPYKKKRV